MSVKLLFLFSQYAYCLCCTGHRGQHQKFHQALISSARLGRWRQRENTIISTTAGTLQKLTFQACGCSLLHTSPETQEKCLRGQKYRREARIFSKKKLQTGLFIRSASCVDKSFVSVIPQEWVFFFTEGVKKKSNTQRATSCGWFK